MNPSYRIMTSTQSSVLMNWPTLVVCCNSWYHFSLLIFLFILISLSFILTCNVCIYFPIYLSIYNSLLSSFPLNIFSLTFFLIFKILTYVTLLSFIVLLSFHLFEFQVLYIRDWRMARVVRSSTNCILPI